MVENLDVLQRVETLPKEAVEINFGEAKRVNRNELIKTGDALNECVGVVLMNQDNVAFAHFPLENRFNVIDSRGKEIKRTFQALSDLLFSKFGTVSQDTEAVIVSGREGKSEGLIRRIRKMLEKKDIQKIKVEGPHSERVAWDVSVDKGNFQSEHSGHLFNSASCVILLTISTFGIIPTMSFPERLDEY